MNSDPKVKNKTKDNLILGTHACLLEYLDAVLLLEVVAVWPTWTYLVA